MPQYKSFNNSRNKIQTTWDTTFDNDNEIKDKNNFKLLVINKSTLFTNKRIQTIDITPSEQFGNGTKGSAELNGFDERNLEYIYPIAFAKLQNRGKVTSNINFIGKNGNLEFTYVFYKVTDTKYLFRYRFEIQETRPDPEEKNPEFENEKFIITVQLVFFNYRIYGNMQKGRE